MKTRSDKIYELLNENGGRLRVSEILKKLSDIEGMPGLHAKVISSTVCSDNKTKDLQGRACRFNRYGDGTEQYGFISIRNSVRIEKNLTKILNDYEPQIPAIIESANFIVRRELSRAIKKLSWKEFESNFLQKILEANGFQEVEITQTTRDNGTDAFCTYRRGLVVSQAIVSAKHWSRKVGKPEVQRLRGIRGPADTGIIVTSASFTSDAVEETEASQNQRKIVLIDANIIAETCINHAIGVKCIGLPKLYKFTELNFDSED